MREKLIIKGSPHKQGNNFEIFGDNETGEIIIRSGRRCGQTSRASGCFG